MSRLHCMHLAACFLAFYAETAFRLVASIGFCLPFYMLLPFANIFLFGYNVLAGPGVSFDVYVLLPTSCDL